jgi:pimeloyl-ACP methyl ester carboxylesterase
MMWTLVTGALAAAAELEVEHKFAENNGVKIHYAAAGEGPLVVFIHGFPDYWYSWHHQMNGLKDEYRVVALDTRGYNKSDKPGKQEAYDMTLLVADVAAVIKAEKREKASIVGHDWGGAIAWRFAMTEPAMTENLIIVNSPHPKGIMRELAHNPEQKRNAQYARDFQKADSHKKLNAMLLAGIVTRNPLLYARYVKALKNSSIEGMMHYYRQNYPREPYTEIQGELPKIAAPVLQFHGLGDTALHHHGLNKTWEWVGKDFTLVTIPKVGHWSHHEAANLVTNTMKTWLKMRR